MWDFFRTVSLACLFLPILSACSSQINVCGRDSECPSGHICEHGECIPLSQHDAGPKADGDERPTAADAGKTDALDAGGAGTSDTGERIPDAGAAQSDVVSPPPNEVCNGIDDDNDGACDEGFACCRGSSETCASACGSEGTRTCLSSCTWSPCQPPDEACNGMDDDCDGETDENCPDECSRVTAGSSIASALNEHRCVEMQEGTHQLDSTVYVPADRELRGLGRDRTVVAPSAGFSDIALIVVAQSGVLLKGFRVTGDAGAKAKLTIAVVGADTENVVMEEMMIDGAKCDGLSMGGEGTVIRNSTLSNNGYDCPPIMTGSAIYAEGNVTISGGQYSHAPQIVGNLIENNPLGSGIDMAEVSDGYIAGNTIRDNGANGGISIYHGHGWTIENNDISNSGGWRNYGHPNCEGPHSPATIGIKLCRDTEIAGGTDQNIIRDNRSIGYYGILLAGKDESAAYLVPRFNRLSGNDVMGSTVGCLDDFRPGQWMDGENVWTDNNCKGTPDTPPDYF